MGFQVTFESENVFAQYDVQSRTYGLKAQVGVIGGVFPGFVTGIHKDSVRRWNLWFPSAGVFAKVLAGRATGTQITFPPYGIWLTGTGLSSLPDLIIKRCCAIVFSLFDKTYSSICFDRHLVASLTTAAGNVLLVISRHLVASLSTAAGNVLLVISRTLGCLPDYCSWKCPPGHLQNKWLDDNWSVETCH